MFLTHYALGAITARVTRGALKHVTDTLAMSFDVAPAPLRQGSSQFSVMAYKKGQRAGHMRRAARQMTAAKPARVRGVAGFGGGTAICCGSSGLSLPGRGKTDDGAAT